MKRILIVGIGDNKNFKEEYILKSLSKLPYEVFILKPITASYWFSNFVTKKNIIIANFNNITECVSKVSLFCEFHNISFDAIFAFKEHMVVHASIIAQAFNCIHTSINNIFHASNNKLMFRKHYNTIMDKNIIKSDCSIVTTSKSINNINFPIVIKPIFGSSSCGVQLIQNKKQINEALKISRQSILDKFSDATDRNFITETYIDGPAFSVDGIIQNKNIIFAGINEYIYGPKPYFIQTGNIIPANISKNKIDLCLKSVSKIIKYFGYNNTPFHAEIILTPNGVYLIEIACRMPGGKIPRGYELAYGFNFVEQVVNLYLGKPVEFKKQYERQVIQKGKHIFKKCELLKVDIPKRLFKEQDFEQISFANEKNSYPSKNKPIYFYTVVSNNIDTAIKKCNSIENAVHIYTT